MNLKEKLAASGLRKAYDYVDKDPKNNIPHIVDFLSKKVPSNLLDGQIAGIREVLSDPTSIWYTYLQDLWETVDGDVRRSIFENFVINATLLESAVNEDLQEKHQCNIPWAILMDPTSACNLHCTGCWAAEYGNKLNLTYEELDGIICQANALGIHFFLYSGGEPLVRKADLIRLCKAHQDCQFLAFTNGTLIDEAFAQEMLKVKNFIPAISVEGFEEDTDFRRGKGTFGKVEKAMAILKANKLPFGLSCCYTKKNCSVIGSEAYFDQMVAWGAKFCWLFTYIPVGNEAVPELMVTAQQRKFMYEQVRKFRKTKPIFTMDFWNDGEFTGGCIAGGRRYLHINANGDIEPCAFIHYSDSNIRKKTLLEALKSPLCMAYHKGQPFNTNHLRPCPLLDNPEALVGMVESSDAGSTDLESPEPVRQLTAKCRKAAQNWELVAEPLWERDA